MRNLLSVSDDISAKVLFIIEEDGRDAGYLKACTMWNMDATIEHVPVSYTHLDVYKRQSMHLKNVST